MVPQDWRVRAAKVYPVDAPSIDNGLVESRAGRIVHVKKYQGEADTLDLGRVALIPGLINCHTHLEFSSQSRPLGTAGNTIVDWIPQVIRARSMTSTDQRKQAIIRGMQESWANGTVAIGEIATDLEALPAYPQSPLEGIIYLERLGSNLSDVDTILQTAESFLECDSEESWGRALSPHAPYSLSWKLFQRLIELAGQKTVPLAMHLAESQEEMQWIENGHGPFRELLDSIGVLEHATNRPKNIGSMIDALGDSPALIIHGNYLTPEHLDKIAGRKNLGIVFCPRTHRFFGHQPYPLKEILRRGIRLGLGTDSRASNPDLSLFREAQQVAHSFPELDPQQILKAATLVGAGLLGLEQKFGSISVGKTNHVLVIGTKSGEVELEALWNAAEFELCWIADAIKSFE